MHAVEKYAAVRQFVFVQGGSRREAASLQEHLLQAAEKFRLQTLTAPIDGTMQELAVHTEGGVVTPAQALMSIVPADSRLEIEAMILNKDNAALNVSVCGPGMVSFLDVPDRFCNCKACDAARARKLPCKFGDSDTDAYEGQPAAFR
jgi:hypothetical protein